MGGGTKKPSTSQSQSNSRLPSPYNSPTRNQKKPGPKRILNATSNNNYTSAKNLNFFPGNQDDNYNNYNDKNYMNNNYNSNFRNIDSNNDNNHKNHNSDKIDKNRLNGNFKSTSDEPRKISYLNSFSP